MSRRVDIDREFAVVVKKCGGRVLDEEIGTASAIGKTTVRFR